MNVSAIILAGGKGTRMESDVPKPLHKIASKTLLDWTLEKLDFLSLEQTVIVVGYQGEEIISKMTRFGIEWAVQPKQVGNADALGYGLSKLSDKTDTILVLQADDSSFYRSETLKHFIEIHQSKSAIISLLSVEKADKTPRFRINKDGDYYCGLTKLADEERGKTVVEFFTGCACFNREWLEKRIDNVTVSSEGEFSVPTLFEMARQENERVIVYKLEDPEEWVGVNTKEQLIKARMLFKSKEATY